jgi:hypothetical protein
MQFEKGNKAGKKGRPIGSKNKMNNALRDKWQRKLERDLPNLWSEYLKLSGAAKVRLGLAMHQLVIPKLQAQKDPAGTAINHEVEITLDLGSNQMGVPDESIKQLEGSIPLLPAPEEAGEVLTPLKATQLNKTSYSIW